MTRILVVGGTGFIGRHVARRAIAEGWDVTTLSLHPTAPVPGMRSIIADLATTDSVRSAIGSTAFEYVVNCGGYVDHTLWARGGAAVFDTHAAGTLRLIGALDWGSIQCFVNLGSSDEYGSSDAPQRESAREMPISPYALGKVTVTQALQMLYRTEGFPGVTLRLFLTYGPGQRPPRIIPATIQACVEGRAFDASVGEQLRDFCFIDDTIGAVFAALRRPAARGEVINVGTGVPVQVRTVIEMIRNMIGRGSPRFGAIAYRPGENMALFPDVTKASDLLGWAASVSLENGLEQMMRPSGRVA